MVERSEEIRPTMSDATSRAPLRLAKTAGVLVAMCTALTHEYGVTINFVVPRTIGVYPQIAQLVPWAMALAGIVMLPKVALYFHFTRHLPRAGSFYVWISRTLGQPAAFVVSFIFWVSLTAAIGLVGSVFTSFVADVFITAGMADVGAMLSSAPARIVIGLALIWLVYWVHASGLVWYGRLVVVSSVIILASALLIAYYCLTTSPDTFVRLAESSTGVELGAGQSNPPIAAGAFVAVTGLLVAAYGGMSAPSSLGGESRDASRSTSRGIVLGWVATFILYTGLTFAIFAAVPWWAAEGLINSAKESVVTAPGLVGLVAPSAIAIGLNVATALIVGKLLFPQMLVCSRTVFAFGQDGVFPDRFAAVNRRSVPRAGLLLTCVLASLFLLQSVLVGWALAVIARSIAILLVLTLLALGLIAAHANPRLRERPWTSGLRKSPWMIAVAVLSIVLSIWLGKSILEVPDTSLAFQPWLQFVVTGVIGLLIYGLAFRLRGREALLQRVSEPPAE